MRLIHNLEKDIFVDEFGNTYTTDQIFTIFSSNIPLLGIIPIQLALYLFNTSLNILQ